MFTLDTHEKNKSAIAIVAVASICFFTAGFSAHAAAPTGSFLVTPAKVELDINPGETVSRDVTIENGTGSDATFVVSAENISGTRGGSETVTFSDATNTTYSLAQNISFAKNEITVANGEKISVPVTITIPQNAEPGGRYGAVLVKAIPSGNASGASVSSQIGVLFFVRVAGDTGAKASLKKFGTKNNAYLFASGDVPLQITFENLGNVHVNPYGKISIRNMFGKTIDEIKLDPWFVLPNSVRTRDVEWKMSGTFGVYRAVLEVNRGYENIVESASVSFVVMPWYVIPTTIVFVAAIVWMLWTRRTRAVEIQKAI